VFIGGEMLAGWAKLRRAVAKRQALRRAANDEGEDWMKI